MASKEEIFAEAKALGIETTPDMHHFTVAAMIKRHKDAAGERENLVARATALNIQLRGDETSDELSSSIVLVEAVNHAVTLGIDLKGGETLEEIVALIKAKEGEPKNQQREPVIPTVTFDINKLTPEQLKELKAKLEDTPSIASNDRHTITIRKFKGKFVIGVKNTSSKVELDTIEQKPVTKITIPVLYYGAKDFAIEDYKEFMSSERVKCEIVYQREVRGRISEGTVYSMELKKEVEQIVNTVVRFYTVRMPDGKEIELFEDAVNL